MPWQCTGCGKAHCSRVQRRRCGTLRLPGGPAAMNRVIHQAAVRRRVLHPARRQPRLQPWPAARPRAHSGSPPHAPLHRCSDDAGCRASARCCAGAAACSVANVAASASGDENAWRRARASGSTSPSTRAASTAARSSCGSTGPAAIPHAAQRQIASERTFLHRRSGWRNRDRGGARVRRRDVADGQAPQPAPRACVRCCVLPAQRDAPPI